MTDSQNENEISEQELSERIAILKRFRALLEQQRQNFMDYLIALERQHEKIELEDVDSVAAHTELTNKIVSDIKCLQKVIVPLRPLYERGASNNEISKIQNDLDILNKEVLVQNKKNRDLLQTKMSQVRSQMSAFASKNPYRGLRSVYAERNIGGTISLES